jgi:acyl-CoA synthetase (AMP-forming)/AMP-acid ligase II
VTQAGAPLPSAVLRDLRARLPAHVAVVLMYGQTEAGARLTCLDPADLDRKPGSVGRAIPGIQLAVVDEGGVEVARGVEGELVARGDSLMAGYWRDPEQTAAVLRPEGLRTRDRAIMDDEGFVRILGRADDMIKSGGHRVAPEEIEEVIRSLPDVVECAVVGAADDLLGERLVAFVVPETRDAVDPRAVQRACLDALPRYLVPSEVVLVDALPRTPSGKLLRRALRERLSLD